MRVNTSIPKVDGKGLIQGKPAFTDDFAPRDALIVKVLRSPYPHATIKSIKVEQALAMPEIKCIFTYENVPEALFTRAGQGFPEPSPYDARILDRTVRYVGDAVAIVAGTTEQVVDLALEKIKVDYEIKEPILEYEHALDNPVLLHEGNYTKSMFPIGHDASRNLAASYEMMIGDMDEVVSKCDVVIKERYYTQAQAHAMSEPHAVVAYMDVQDRLTLVTSTQAHYHIRRIVSKAIGIPLSRIRVIKPRVGGGFGGKQGIHGEIYAGLVTLKTGKPSKMVYTRREVFESTYTRHPMRIDMTVGAMKDGTIKALNMEVLSNTGAYGEHALTVLMVAGAKTLPMYNKVESVAFKGEVVYTNTSPAGAYRGYGAIQGNFALESILDELAHRLDMDPLALRLKNIIHEGETSDVFKKMGEGTEGVEMIIESCKLETCLHRVKDSINWQEKYPKKMISPHRVRGVGLALAMQGSGIPCIDMGAAVLKLNDGGFFNLTVGATDIGTGSDTVLAQIAAETLKVPVDQIVIYSSDTDLAPFDKGAYASSTTYVSGNGVKKAAENMIKTIEEKAKQRYQAKEVTYEGAYLLVDGAKKSFSEFATELYYSHSQEQLVATGSFVGEKSPPPYMAGAAEVEVDLRTGIIEVVRYDAYVDCGVPINPNLSRIQVEGALLQGIGMTLYEEADYLDNGRLFNNSFLTYKVPTRMDVGPMTVSFVESYEPSGPYGAKSVGEIGIDTPPAAIANAIFNATGIRIRSLPITSEVLYRAMKK
ncbi:xanthine dehydrogenase family protein molybdopterin-binding subunit [Fusibacter tunisiensis]|uniref:CO/xanthine dehydrogenase Mo-binding subunit n=1 Tax=Fusibacter tunisiensis TaxID=1008308 RepID=A0ABS2MQX5_9FIRM|nr:CO/xanthine dehydrogenase Mo-binding subunit [Fusibacter tunisiensis]